MSALEKIQSKIQDWEEIKETVTTWREAGQKVVFTNGCFDILHYGHLHYLAQASDLADRLVIGLNATDSVRRLKGPNRPIHDDATRLNMLAGLQFVDAVVIFEEDTPFRLIEWILPDVLVKGGDWQPDQIVGSDVVLGHGGAVRSLTFIPGYSTTKIENKIRSW